MTSDTDRAAPFAGLSPPGWLLSGLALLLVGGGAAVHLAAWDRPWMLRVHAVPPGSFAVALWSCLTIVGVGWAALMLVLAADRGHGRLVALLAPVFVLGSLLTHVPKRILHFPRPAATALLPQLHVIGDAFHGPVSMPSGHALTAAATAVLLCLVIPRSRWPVAVAVLCAGAAVAWSRVVVAAHWPSDVLVGAGLGLLAVGACLAALNWPRARALHEGLAARIRTRAGQWWIMAAETGLAAGLLGAHTGYPQGRPMVAALVTGALFSIGLRWRALRGGLVLPRAVTPLEHP